jgi:hypothetical protein
LSCRRFGADPVYPDRLRDVLDLLLAQIVEAQRQLVADLAVRRGRNANRAGLGKRLQPGRDVDPVAEQIDAIDDDVADMHANAQLHRLVDGIARVLRGDRSLDRDRALHGIDRAAKVGDDAIAGGVEDAAPVRCDQLIDDDAACLQPRERADFVARHQPAVASNVGGEDCGQFALYRRNVHPSSSSCRSIASRAIAARHFGRNDLRPVL